MGMEGRNSRIAYLAFWLSLVTSCPDGFEYYFRPHRAGGQSQPSCYKLIDSTNGWNDAREICRYLGVDLLSIETKPEYRHIVNAFRLTRGFIGFSSRLIWTSGSDIDNENEWKWMATGAPVNYAAWHKGEPDNRGDADCLGLWFRWDWYDIPCHVAGLSVCEINA